MFKTNEYFEGRVVSIAFQGETLPATVGVMAAGDYQFSTGKPETMKVISGRMSVQLPGADDWQTFSAGESFELPGDSQFQVRIDADCAYLCLYH